MKKKDIINLMYLKSEKERLYSLYTTKMPWNIANDTIINDNLKILKEEYNDSKIDYENILNKIKDIKCDHTVRLVKDSCYYNDYECVLCGESINPCNVTNGDTIYNDPNRNNYYIAFRDYYFNEVIKDYTGLKNKEIIKKILKVLNERDNDEEVDLVKLLKNDKDVFEIEEKEYKKYYYILLIGGSNLVSINNSNFINVDSYNNDNLVNYLLSIPNVILEVFDNKEYKKADRSKIYTNLLDLENLIKKEKDVPFDFIIDNSNLFDSFSLKKHYINLKDIFYKCNNFINNENDIKKISIKKLLK